MSDPKTHRYCFKWRRQFESMPIYILARRGPESLLWKDDWVHGLATTNEPFRIYCDDPSELKDEFQRYWAPAEEGSCQPMALISSLRQACRTMMQILVSLTWMAPFHRFHSSVPGFKVTFHNNHRMCFNMLFL